VGRVYAQENLFDAELVKKEIEIMKSIFSTALTLSERGRSQREREFEEAMGRRRVEGYHLYGQGTVFSVSVPAAKSARLERLREVSDRLRRLEESGQGHPEVVEAQLDLLASQGDLYLEEAYVAALEPMIAAQEHAAQAEALAREAEERQAEISEEEQERIRAHLGRLRERLTEVEAATEESIAEAQALRSRMKDELLEVVAKHGDSMSHLQNDHYINLLLVPSSRMIHSWDSSEAATILSIKKSDILAFKSGQLSLDAFKGRVLEY
jgi:hypothetical protein